MESIQELYCFPGRIMKTFGGDIVLSLILDNIVLIISCFLGDDRNPYFFNMGRSSLTILKFNQSIHSCSVSGCLEITIFFSASCSPSYLSTYSQVGRIEMSFSHHKISSCFISLFRCNFSNPGKNFLGARSIQSKNGSTPIS